MVAQTRQGLQFTHTPSVEAYVGQTNMSCLASSNSCMVHAFEEATIEGSNEPAHLHILTRVYSLCIQQVRKYI